MSQSTTPRFPPPPRKVRRTVASGCALALPRLFILPHMIIGIMLLLHAPVQLYVEQFGNPTLATVDRLETRNTRKGGWMYLVYYHFNIDGQRHDENRSVGRSAFANLHAGDTVYGRTSFALYFSIFFQNEHFIGPPPSSEGSPLITLFASIFWNGLVGVFAHKLWLTPFQQRRLIRSGVVAPGHITANVPRGKSGRRIAYSFTTNQGKLRFGSQEADSNSSAPSGTPCTVFYQPTNPKRSIAYEFSGLRIIDSSIDFQ